MSTNKIFYANSLLSKFNVHEVLQPHLKDLFIKYIFCLILYSGLFHCSESTIIQIKDFVQKL